MNRAGFLKALGMGVAALAIGGAPPVPVVPPKSPTPLRQVEIEGLDQFGNVHREVVDMDEWSESAGAWMRIYRVTERSAL